MPDAMTRVHEVVESTYRSDSRRGLATLVRLLGDFDVAAEALHDAFVAAMERWPVDGVPANPRAWLVSAGRFKASGKTGRGHGRVHRGAGADDARAAAALSRSMPGADGGSRRGMPGATRVASPAVVEQLPRRTQITLGAGPCSAQSPKILIPPLAIGGICQARGNVVIGTSLDLTRADARSEDVGAECKQPRTSTRSGVTR